MPPKSSGIVNTKIKLGTVDVVDVISGGRISRLSKGIIETHVEDIVTFFSVIHRHSRKVETVAVCWNNIVNESISRYVLPRLVSKH